MIYIACNSIQLPEVKFHTKCIAEGYVRFMNLRSASSATYWLESFDDLAVEVMFDY